MAVKIRVISQKGTCVASHYEGDEFMFSENTPSGICPWAFYTLFPFINVLQYGGTFPWQTDADTTTVACPDPDNPVVFELTRINEE